MSKKGKEDRNWLYLYICSRYTENSKTYQTTNKKQVECKDNSDCIPIQKKQLQNNQHLQKFQKHKKRQGNFTQYVKNQIANSTAVLNKM